MKLKRFLGLVLAISLVVTQADLTVFAAEIETAIDASKNDQVDEEIIEEDS